jgi:tRNA dimethylallyltransferase
VRRAPVIAIYGPTASGKTAVAGELLGRLDAEVVSADSAALYAGLPVLTAAPPYPARLVGTVPLTEDVSVGGYQRLAHAAIDELVAAGRTALVVGGTGLYLRAALSAFELPPPPAPGARERWAAEVERLGSEAAHAALAEVDPAAAARIHPNDRKRLVRALELAEAGASLAPVADRLWTDDTRHPTLLVVLELPASELDRRIEQRTSEMAASGAIEEARRAWAQPLSETARKVMGLEAFATLSEPDAVAEVVRATRRLARYQRKWLRRLPGAVRLHANRPAAEIADDILAVERTGQRLSRR